MALNCCLADCKTKRHIDEKKYKLVPTSNNRIIFTDHKTETYPPNLWITLLIKYVKDCLLIFSLKIVE